MRTLAARLSAVTEATGHAPWPDHEYVGRSRRRSPGGMYLVDDSHATLDETDLGRPTRLEDNPTIGDVPLPASGVLAQGQAVWRVVHEGALT